MPNRKKPTAYTQLTWKEKHEKNPFSAPDLQKKLTKRKKMLDEIK